MKITKTNIITLGAGLLMAILLAACATYPDVGNQYVTNYKSYTDGETTKVKMVEAEISASPKEVIEESIEVLKELAGKDVKKLQINRGEFRKIGATSAPVVENGKNRKIVVVKFDPKKPGFLITNYKSIPVMGVQLSKNTVIYFLPIESGTKVVAYTNGKVAVSAEDTVKAIQAKF